MPEARSFGRRGIPQAPRPFDGPAWEPADIEPAGQDELSARARMLRLAGELLAFAGLFVALVTAVFQALHPVASVLTKIYIPELLGEAITFTSPDAPLQTQYLMPYAATLAWPAIAAFGVFGIARGRWLLGGLCAATLAFPWSIFGVVLPYAPAWLAFLAGAAALRVYRPRGIKLVLSVILGLLFGPLAVALLAGVLTGLMNPHGTPNARYNVVTFADLEANRTLPVTDRDENGREIVRVSTLSALPTRTGAEANAKAFAMAQEYVIRGDVARTQQALATLAQSGYVPNGFERDRLDEIGNALTELGAFGAQPKADLAATQNIASWLSRITLYFAIALGVLGPVAEWVAGRINKRQGRIRAAEEELAGQRAQRVPEAAKGFGRRDGGAGIQSISAIDGEATLESIDRRLRLYVLGVVALGVTTLVCGVAGWAMWLPDAASNTAFQRVALTAMGAEWARDSGLRVVTGPLPFSQIITMAVMPGSLVIIVALIFLRRFAPYIAGAALAVLVVWQIASFFFVDQAFYEVEAATITREMRAELARDAAAPTVASAKGTVRQSFSNIGKPRSQQLTLQPAYAALILAQLDYIEGKPAEIGRWLEVMGQDRKAIDALDLEQRFDLMREWAGANGYPSSAEILAPNQILPMSVSRALAMPAIVVAVIAALGTIGIICLVPIAADRRRRIEGLVEQVRYRQDEYRVAR